jgi:hypothetical protein
MWTQLQTNSLQHAKKKNYLVFYQEKTTVGTHPFRAFPKFLLPNKNPYEAPLFVTAELP